MPFSLPAGGRLAVLGLSLAAVLAATGLGAPASAADPVSPYGPQAPQNPATAANGAATMHGDSASSGTTPYPGPGTGAITYSRTALASACPTVVVGGDGYVISLCTTIFGQTPTVHLLDPATGADLASLALPKGSLFGGVYAYLDNTDRLVVVDGGNNLVRIGHHRDGSGWALRIDQSTPLGGAVPAGDNIVGLTPAWDGRVWFATSGGVIGTVDTGTGAVRSISTGEGVQNSISTVPGRTAVATDHALYLLSAAPDGTPVVDWRAPYDRGPARKPGQLSWGTGTTPSFFGPDNGTEYVTIVDNAAPHGNLLVYRADGGPEPVCRIPVLTQYARSGTEDAVIASGRSVFVTNTYGYPYPALPEGAPASQPSSAGFDGGLSRIDVNVQGTGCEVVWNSPVKSAALPRLSLADGKIYTVSVTGPTGSAGLNTFAQYHHSVIDPATGAQLNSSFLGIGLVYNPLQMRGTAAPDGTLYQGTETGVVRISRR
ncbi:hypothetical protein [Streptomyces lavendulae]|uniref:hypothetical protein n=1 Tax=Streptomyces lavendulae TaxID=1914 RepID=UPI0024A1633D|nr:hypothetical protein [Streptomyces lavendulae]GLX16571.1 hypothetical protein Slala01_02150 [Streptomyces lavendulae subsp. lavendulae]GLX25191.1 hypothetical protein Slala02_10110 [Streptomyces lavendulae subsp. lavendulae]